MLYKNFLISVLLDASGIARNYFGKTTAQLKKDNTVVTEADLAVGAFLVDAIKKEYPLYSIVDEERGVIDNASDFTWVIDPIDGTSNFAAGVPLYGILLGLLYKDRPVAGGIALPALYRIYTAEKGGGAFCNGERIYTTREKKLANVIVAYGCNSSFDATETTIQEDATAFTRLKYKSRGIRMTLNIFDPMMVAEGGFGVWMSRSTKIWDNVATHSILEEAGCLYTDFYGNPIDYSRWRHDAEKKFTVCTANSELHADAQKIIHSNV